MRNTLDAHADVMLRARAVFGATPDPEPWIEPFRAALGSFRAHEIASWSREAFESQDTPQPHTLHAVEQWIRLARPVLSLRGTTALSLPERYRHCVPTWDVYAARLLALGERSCRIENATSQPVGSGFQLTHDRVLTHVHVLDAITFGSRMIVPGESCVRFHVEEQSSRESVSRMIVGASWHDRERDLVLLHIETKECLLEALNTRVPSIHEPVALLSFPFADAVHNPPFVGAILGRNAGVLRASVGVVCAVHDTRFMHDALATHGSSGGVIVSLQTGDCLGIHATRTFAWRAHAAWVRSLNASDGETASHTQP